MMVGRRRKKISFKSDDKEIKCHAVSTITLSAVQYITVGGP
jgi:hypothetical protein